MFRDGRQAPIALMHPNELDLRLHASIRDDSASRGGSGRRFHNGCVVGGRAEFFHFILENALLLTLLFIFGGAFLTAFLRSRAKDRCLKHFHGYRVNVEKKDKHARRAACPGCMTTDPAPSRTLACEPSAVWSFAA